LFAATITAYGQTAPHAKQWQRVDNCRVIPNRFNDGDSFHVSIGDEHREIVVRLYFVDTPEAETAYRDRLDEQGAYFGINRDQAIQIAHESTEFTKQRLAQPFTIWTRWRSALGRSAIGRVYCIVIDSTGRDLIELLVENELARIYGTKTPLQDRRDSRTYVDQLKQLENKAKSERKGAWRFSPVAVK
jgi:endonuclease YncB( thermonuclease family)